MVNIHNLIAAISPDTYCKGSVRDKVKEAVKKEGYLAGAKIAEPVEPEPDFNIFSAQADPLSAFGLKAPIEKHKLGYDSPNEQLEPVYFWILDFLSKITGKVEKLVDSFVASPGSGHFAEFGQKRTRMQEEGMKILGVVGQMVKSVLNIVYDLKEFEIRLDLYRNYRGDDKGKKSAAILSLKQIWMDTVDIQKRGTTALKQLAAQYDYVTIIDAFMKAEKIDDILKPVEEGGLDLNERVKRIVVQRVDEFYRWIDESEKELTKRYEVEKSYLKNQVDTIKMYSRWVYPYLRAATQLEMSDQGSTSISSDPSLVNLFSTAITELVLLGSSGYKPDDDVDDGELPKVFSKVKTRKYSSIIIVEFKYRTMPNRLQRGDYSYGGRAEVVFTSYGLNDEELEMLRKSMEDMQFGEVLKMIRGATTDSLDKIQGDIDHYLNPDKEKKKPDEEKKSEDFNPFTSLFSAFFGKKKEKKAEKKDLTKGIEKDSMYEKVIRSQAILAARKSCFTIYDVYKKQHGMPSHPDPFSVYS